MLLEEQAAQQNFICQTETEHLAIRELHRVNCYYLQLLNSKLDIDCSYLKNIHVFTIICKLYISSSGAQPGFWRDEA